MKHLLFVTLCVAASSLLSCVDPGAGETATNAETATDSIVKPPIEFADAKYMELAKQSMKTFSNKDIAAWTQGMSDDTRYLWNSGDSLVGKQAVIDFWTNRMTTVIDSLTLQNEIYLPVNVHEPQSTEQAGVWVLGWAFVTAKYQATGKKMQQWVHIDMHFNSNDKIDQTVLYVDRLAIQQASTN